MNLEEAKKSGAMALFGENMMTMCVLSMGDFSVELVELTLVQLVISGCLKSL